MNLSEKISLILVDKGFSLSPKKNTEDLINSGTEFHKSNEDIKIAEPVSYTHLTLPTSFLV